MTEPVDDFRMGFMLDHIHTMMLLKISLAKDITTESMLCELIQNEWLIAEGNLR